MQNLWFWGFSLSTSIGSPFTGYYFLCDYSFCLCSIGGLLYWGKLFHIFVVIPSVKQGQWYPHHLPTTDVLRNKQILFVWNFRSLRKMCDFKTKSLILIHMTCNKIMWSVAHFQVKTSYFPFLFITCFRNNVLELLSTLENKIGHIGEQSLKR